ncbi:type VI secretion system-associated FHA domain protein TagH [uncultured Tateyamaria sp.]|uniref:type VI secretion system-associated FHA domain protein TagH n=1 Tax=uncultured Tateyamaria sp. TaxID=455651 RepID=UPI00260AE43F|nr:type VI secretion system-associated FHA domain protein TagH [uncultured Tateyamaria sp.]
MTVNLIIESAATPQARMSFTYEFGQVVIGRGADADWQLDDPERYLSRSHCILAIVDGKLTATDASRGGTFVDGSETALGTGNSVVLEDGMRLRMGDFVFRVDMAAETAQNQNPEIPQRKTSHFDFSQDDTRVRPEPAPRPESLPDPFDPYDHASGHSDTEQIEASSPKPFGLDDPFDLDLADRTPQEAVPSSGGYFDAPISRDEATAPVETPDKEREDTVVVEFTSDTRPIDTNAVTTQETVTDGEVLAALLNGMGLGTDAIGSDPVTQATEIGRQYRLLIDGVMQLLRARASAKQQVRVAQTLISSADVNPLKFLTTADDALDAMISGDRPGYQSADDAIVGAYRDLADHQLRTWHALQSALRRMIDQFDPEQIEKEIAETGVLEALLAGGKSAQLWQTYTEKYKEIARAAEERFLGEVGDNFRDAYEGNGKETSR